MHIKNIILALILMALLTPASWAAIFTVTKTADTTESGSLRWAITQANGSAGRDTINFNIPTSEVTTEGG